MALMREWVEQWLDATDRKLGTTNATVPKSLIVELCRFWLAHQWQDISSAPKDTEVLVMFHDCACQARWIDHRQGGNWYTAIGSQVLIYPTHWQPLPEPPLPHAKEDEKV